MKDLLLVLPALAGCLSLVAWGSEKARNIVLNVSIIFQRIKNKISEYKNIFISLSAAINICSGVYVAYILLMDKDLLSSYFILSYAFLANLVVFILGVILYFLNVPIKVIHGFLSWTIDHNFENRWKLTCVVLIAVPTAYQVLGN